VSRRYTPGYQDTEADYKHQKAGVASEEFDQIDVYDSTENSHVVRDVRSTAPHALNLELVIDFEREPASAKLKDDDCKGGRGREGRKERSKQPGLAQ
jgi:hypothetical protein